MSARLRLRRPSHATVVAYLALFVALGGTTAYAANEWNGSNIQNETLTGADIQNGTLTGQEIFDNTLSGADITNNSVTRDDVQNGSLTGGDLADLTVRGNDIGFNTITGENVLDGALQDEDIAKGTFVNFTLAFPSPIAAHDCAIQPLNGVGAQGDHLLLTPNVTTGGGRVVYSATYDDSNENAWVTACNTWTNSITPGNVRFNLLVIDSS